jgi:hypothetical protein
MDNVEIQERLAQMDETYRTLPDEQIPEGEYQAQIVRFDFFEGRSGDVFLKTELAIRHDPTYEGEIVEAISNLTDEDKLRWTRKFLNTIGYTGALSDLLTGLEDFVGLPVSIAIKYSERTNDFGEHYRNIYVNRRLGELQAPGSDVDNDTSTFSNAQTTPVDDSSIPF